MKLANGRSVSAWMLILSSIITVQISSPVSTAQEIKDISWSLAPESPIYIKGGALGVVEGVLVSAGGVSNDGITNENRKTYGYNISTNTWTAQNAIPDLPNFDWNNNPIGLGYLDGVSLDNKLYVVGGREGGSGSQNADGSGGASGRTQDSVYRLVNVGGANPWVWENLPPLQTSGAYFTLGVDGTKIVANVGGRWDRGGATMFYDRQTRETQVYDTSQLGPGQDPSAMLPILMNADDASIENTMAAVGGKLYTFGGLRHTSPNDASDRLPDVQVLSNPYSPGSTWVQKNDFNPGGFVVQGVNGMDTAVYGDRYIIMIGGEIETAQHDFGTKFAGRSEEEYNNMVFVFDTLAADNDPNRIRVLPTLLPKGGGDIRVAIVGDTIYALGGERRLRGTASLADGDVNTTEPDTTPTNDGDNFTYKVLRVGKIHTDQVYDTYRWIGGDGSNKRWFDNTATNWTPRVPNGPGQTVILDNRQAPTTITLDAPASMTDLQLDSTQPYTLTGDWLILQRPSPLSTAGATIQVAQNGHTISSPIQISTNTTIQGNGQLTTAKIYNPNTLTIATNVVTGDIDPKGRFNAGGGPVEGTTVVTSGKSLTATHIRQKKLSIQGTGMVTIAAGGSSYSTSIVQELEISANGANPTAKIDLKDNDLIVDYINTSPYYGIRENIIAGRNGGAWNGNGITSSLVAADSAHKALGYALDTALGLSGSFEGLLYDSPAILVKFTWLGDANLDGKVDASDSARFAMNTTGGWDSGDFNYDGLINSADLSILNAHMGYGVTIGTQLPEPTAAACLLAGLSLVRRRRIWCKR